MTTPRHNSRPRNTSWPGGPAARAGSVLLVVLVIIVLLALGAYTFSETMIAEQEAVAMHGRQIASRALADSAVAYAATLLGQRQALAQESLVDNPLRFQHVLLAEANTPRGRGRFSVVAPRAGDPSSAALRFGLVDESGKLNLNEVARRVEVDQLDEEQARAILLGVPGMTMETADAILDWIDADDVPRRFGAESEFYLQLEPPYLAANAPLPTLETLLRVRGVTRELLLGEDTNRNGLLDANENDGPESPPDDDADNTLTRGWRAWLTTHSREANLRRDGRPKIDVNQPSLTQLFQQVADEFGDDVADFVVSYRRGGQDAPESAPAAGGAAVPAGQQNELRRIASLYELIGAELGSESGGAALPGPWTTDPQQLRQHLPRILDTLTTGGGRFRAGRLNINLAPRSLLATVPGMTPQLVDLMVARQARQSGGSVAAPADPLDATTAWLLLEGHVDLARMRQLDRYITARGDVYRAQVIGYFDAGATATRLEAVIDATYRQPRVVSLTDLTELGIGFTRRQLTFND